MPKWPLDRRLWITLPLLCLAVFMLRPTATTQQLNSSTTLASPNFAISTTGGHILTNVANNDTAGAVTIGSGTSTISHNFVGYTSAPACTVTPTSDPAAVGVISGTWWVTTSAAAVTVHTHNNVGSSGIAFNYVCVGNPT